MINKAGHYILGIYHFAIMLRDTLEYTFRKDNYNIAAYKARRQAFEKALEEKAQIKQILTKLGENGSKVETKLQEFNEIVYSDTSTVLKATSDELRVDHAQHLIILEMVVGLHQTFWDILAGYLQAATSRQDLNIDLGPLFEADERLYRTIALQSLMNEIEKVFLEFQKAMHESRGAKTPQSNYIINDLTKLVQLVNFQKAHNRIKDTAFNEMVDGYFRVLEMIEGKRELPLMREEEVNPETKQVGVMINGVRHHSFPEVFRQAREVNRAILMESENVWKERYLPIHQELMTTLKEGANGAPQGPFDA
jgi:hypothetical protein